MKNGVYERFVVYSCSQSISCVAMEKATLECRQHIHISIRFTGIYKNSSEWIYSLLLKESVEQEVKSSGLFRSYKSLPQSLCLLENISASKVLTPSGKRRDIGKSAYMSWSLTGKYHAFVGNRILF